jgi:seryl-tRNA synthetase
MNLDLAQAHGWIDAPRGTKVSGSRFIYRIGDLALLDLALYRYALARVTEKGHIP